MALQTDLSRSPYYDDYDVNKNFYKILYRPGVALQTRELNQMQTIAQDQIEKFGRFVFKDGSITEGCSFTFDDSYNFVKINDNFSNNAAFTITDFIGKIVTNGNGLKATVVNAVQGYQSQDPDLNTLYVKYLNTSNTGQSVFTGGDNLVIATSSNVAVGNVTVANPANSSPTGIGYAFTTTAGNIFKKGFFITVEPQTIIVSKYNNSPDNISVGFDAIENIITPEADSSLYDNAAGSPNYSAPGAHRLQLVPTLVTRTTNNATANSSSFFSLCDFKSGKPVSIKNTPQLAALGGEIARRTYETNGNYVVYPFVLTTEAKASTDANNASYVNLLSSRGLGYVEGYRVEFVNNNKVDLRKGTDYQTLTNQIISANFGYYVFVNEYCGEFNTGDSIVQLELHSVAKTAVSSSSFLSTSYSSATKIGTAFARGFAYNSGTIGSSAASYIVYLFDVQMLPGYNFSQVKSVISYSGSLKGVADIITTYNAQSNTYGATIQQSKYSNMIFPTGQKAIKLDGFNNIQYVYRKKSSSSFANTSVSTASMTTSLPATPYGTGVETINNTGTLTGIATRPFLVYPTADGYSLPKSGTVAVTTTSTNTGSSNVVGTTTQFLTEYMVGDYIYINNVKRIISTISNNTFLQVGVRFANTFSASANVHQKAFPNGLPIDFSKSNGTINRQITATANSITFTLGETVNGAFNATTYYDVLRASTVPIKKSISKNVYIAINCASHSSGTTGPWSLGLPDVSKINAIYINDGSFSNSGVNYSSSFKFDNGQRDSYYDLALISLTTSGILTSNSRIIVDADVFTYNYSAGVGFFTANSYPVDANTANTSAITVQQIPQYTSRDGSVFDLRDSIDFRPYATNTATTAANSTSWSGSVTVNPSSSLSFAVPTGATYLPSADSNFEADLTHYLGRVDKAVIRDDGTLAIIEGNPSNTPTPPADQAGSMTLGQITVPPYPSLSTPEAKTYNRYDYAITNTITQNKRYTMKDINSLSNKIDNLEYYTSLSLLEKSATDTLVRSGTTGQNRFQNGILVDSFAGHDIGNTQDPYYNIAIDADKTELRGAFNRLEHDLVFNATASTNVTKTGQMVSLNYTEVSYISQSYATKYRNCIDGNIFTWKADIVFDPPGATAPDLTKAPDVVTNIDLSSNWTALGASAFGTQWGNWNTQTKTVTTPGQASKTSATDAYGNIINTTNQQVTTSTTTTQQRAGQALNAAVSTNQYNLGTFVTDVSILPYVPSMTVKVTTNGLKPNTRVYLFMNNKDVTGWFKQTDSTFATITKLFGGAIPPGSSGNIGFYTDSTGSLYGFFTIPPNTFKATTLEMKIVDVSNIVTGADAITTQASGTFYATNISTAKGSSILNTTEAVLSVKEVSQQTSTTTVSTQNVQSVEVIPGPTPDPGQPDPQEGSGGGCCFDPDAKVLMADGSWKRIIDVVVGDSVRSPSGRTNNVTGTKNTTVADRKMIKIESYDFYTTDDHLFLTTNGWKTWRPDRLIDNNRDNAIYLEGENRHTPLNDEDVMIFVDGDVTKFVPYKDLNVEVLDFDPEYVVYDLHLDGDLSYVINGFAVHNCGCGGGACCFDPDAKVLMADGSWKRIADVVIGDRVLGSDNKINTVVGTKTTTVADRKMFKFPEHNFYTTDDHLFLTTNGWKTWRPDRLVTYKTENSVFLEGENRVKSIDENDNLIYYKDGKYIEVPFTSVEGGDHESDYIVHDLHLDGNLTYIVEGFVVHNCCECFIAGSQVSMADGTTRNIEDIKENDLLLGVNGPVKVEYLKVTTLGNRKLLSFENEDLKFSEEHPFWTKQDNKQWFWTGNKDIFKWEVDIKAFPGLKDNDSIRSGIENLEFAHVDGWKTNEIVEVNKDEYTSDLPLYLPLTNGEMIIVNGYVVGTDIDEEKVDYTNINWNGLNRGTDD